MGAERTEVEVRCGGGGGDERLTAVRTDVGT